MKLEVGKYYKTHDGRKAFVAYEIPNTAKGYCSFAGWVGNHSGNVVSFWKEDGYCGADTLISEWVEKPEWCRGNPAWARWQAHDEDGECYWFSEKPSHDKTAWGFQVVRNGSIGLVPHDFTPMLPKSCAWTESLIEAPEGWGK